MGTHDWVSPRTLPAPLRHSHAIRNTDSLAPAYLVLSRRRHGCVQRAWSPRSGCAACLEALDMFNLTSVVTYGLATALISFVTSFAPPASAAVTFDYSFSEISCGHIDHAGVTTFDVCATPSYFASIGFDHAEAFLYATLTYHYTDDGLPLGRRDELQTDWSGLRHVVTDYEAAAINVSGSGCASRECNPYATGVGYQVIVLGLNDHPDDLTGSVRLFTGIEDGFFSTTLFLSADTQILAAPIPEPSSWALMLLGLAMLPFAAGSLRRQGPSKREAQSVPLAHKGY
jgi:PEP-CTERM motif